MCNEQYCPDCINNSTTLDLEEKELQQLYDHLPEIPLQISLAYDERCNHACPSCRKEFFCASKEYQQDLVTITKNIEPYLGKVKHIATNGIGDLFVSHELLNMLSRFCPSDPDMTMFIETNGVLFKNNWDKIKHLAGHIETVSITPNSFDRETYKYLAGVDDLDKFEESMAFITELKHKGAIKRIRIIMVIQDSNFRQIPQFIQKCIDYDADDIVLRPIFKWFGMQEDELLYKNVLNPCHPYYQEYLEILKNPICQDPRVFNWGYNVEQESIPFPTLEMQREYEEMKTERTCQEAEREAQWNRQMQENCEWQRKVDELSQRLSEEIDKNQTIINGNSWKLTAPLRKLRKLLGSHQDDDLFKYAMHLLFTLTVFVLGYCCQNKNRKD